MAALTGFAPPARAEQDAPAHAEEGRVDARFGRGVTFREPDGAFDLQLRARAQLRYTGTLEDEGGGANEAAVRRLRVTMRGRAGHRELEYYVQLGFATLDMESDVRVPLRDAYVTWAASRDVRLRVGQMKVPYGLQRRVSSGSLQLVDRSTATAELNLDRDVGLKLLSEDLFGLDRLLAYEIGVFGGDGRNRSYPDPGVLVAGRVQLKPLGGFEDKVEGDCRGASPLRFAVALSGGYNAGTRRAQSTIGEVYTDRRVDYAHLGADATLKWAGLSLQAEWFHRRGAIASGAPIVGPGADALRSGQGYYVQSGYAVAPGVEIAARYGSLAPLEGDAVHDSMERRQELGGGVGWYPRDHDLKWQADLFRLADRSFADGSWQLRTQLQFWF